MVLNGAAITTTALRLKPLRQETEMSGFDAQAYKSTTRDQWNSVAQKWDEWGPLLDRWLGPPTEARLDMCAVGPGSHVLHVAGGSGHDAVFSARRTGPTGRVLSTDFSETLTALAEQRFANAGLSHARAALMDGESIDVQNEKFDVVISRAGLIFFPDQDRSMAQQVAVLNPGERIGALVYATPQECRFFSDPVNIVRRHAALPPPASGQTGPFSLGAPGVIEALFQRAGLSEIETRKIGAAVILRSAAECLRFEQESFGALHQMLGKLDEPARQAAWDEVRTALESFETDRGFEGPCVMIAAAGRKIG
jgi:ubiquinone/menaquinone biosynthesis C-methylase UbiE